jgi:cobalt-zinc-cadmium efflux system outer membrane protein
MRSLEVVSFQGEIMRLLLQLGLLTVALSPRAGAEIVSEEGFLSAFTEESAAVRALTEGLARAEADRKRAGVLGNPRIDFWREQPDEHPRVTNWTFSWTPPLDGRYALGKKGADAGLAAARERFVAAKAVLRGEIRAAFASWSLAFERREVLRRQLERVRSLAEVERHRARVGEESGLSARRFTLAEAEVRAALGMAEAAYARAEALARGWRPDLAQDTVPARAAPPEPPTTADPALSPQVRALTLEAEQAALVRKRMDRFLVFPTLQLGWQQISNGGVAGSGPIFAAGWTIPLFDRDQGARVEAERRQQVAAARVELAKARVTAEVEGTAAAYHALLAASRAADRASEESEVMIASATAAFRAGESSLTDLLDSLRAALGARVNDIELRGQALETHRELEEALGRPLIGGGF